MEKHRLEELKKMSLEELKAISRPLEVGETIQEGDFSGQEFACASIGLECSGAIKWYRPDKPADEIKLGWYRHSDGWFFELLGFRHPSDVYRHKCIGYRYDGAACCFSSERMANEFTYLGTTLPEPGEWVDPGEVKLSELPIRARFLDEEESQWVEGYLASFRGADGISFRFGGADDEYYRFCQVWRPSK